MPCNPIIGPMPPADHSPDAMFVRLAVSLRLWTRYGVGLYVRPPVYFVRCFQGRN